MSLHIDVATYLKELVCLRTQSPEGEEQHGPPVPLQRRRGHCSPQIKPARGARAPHCGRAKPAAAAGDFGPVEKLLDLFSKPYEEPSATAACTAAAATASSEDDADGRFFRREVALEKKPGVAFMT